jgi:hypothetical protein
MAITAMTKYCLESIPFNKDMRVFIYRRWITKKERKIEEKKLSHFYG